MDDIQQKAERVREIVEGNFGTIIGRDGDTIIAEVPSDISVILPWGNIGVVARVTGQTTRLAPRRVASMNGKWVECPNDMVTQAYYTLSIDLAASPSMRIDGRPDPGGITRPTPPPSTPR